MNEPAFTRLVLTLLLLVCAALLYLDWMRNAAIEAVNVRIDGLQPPRPLQPRTTTAEPPPLVAPEPPPEHFDPWATAPVEPAPAAPEIHPLLRDVLRAHTDTELSGFAQ